MTAAAQPPAATPGQPTATPDLLYTQDEEDLRSAVRPSSPTGPTRRR